MFTFSMGDLDEEQKPKPARARTGKLRARVDMINSLRQSPDKDSPLYHKWHSWPKGTVFTPPAHMRVDLALARGIAEEV